MAEEKRIFSGIGATIMPQHMTKVLAKVMQAHMKKTVYGMRRTTGRKRRKHTNWY